VLFDLKKNTQDESKMHLQMKLMLDAATIFQKLLLMEKIIGKNEMQPLSP